MKKRLLATAVATMLALSTGITMASPADGVKLDGSVSLQYRNDGGVNDLTSYIGKFILNANVNLDNHFDFYARLGAENLSDASSTGRDFSSEAYAANKKSAAGIDLFGFNYQNAGYNYVIGRQTAHIGATSTLYSSRGNIGKNAFVDGITMTTKSGVTDLKAVVAQTDNVGSNDANIYALSGSYHPSKDVTLGATLAKYSEAADRNYWAVNAGYNLGKATFTGEYAQSDAKNDNKAYNITADYAIDEKNSVYVIAHRTEASADMGGNTDFNTAQQGFYYGYNYKFTKDNALSVFYKDNKYIGSDNKQTSLRTTYNVNF